MAHVLMLCHDQHLDRRVVAQASTLIENGHKVTLFALSYTGECESSVTEEGIFLERIGLNNIRPSNKIFVSHNKLQNLLYQKFYETPVTRWPRSRKFAYALYRGASWFNLRGYQLALFARYRNRGITDPLPFTLAFVGKADELELDRPDVIQVHDLPALEAGVQLKDLFKCPLVYDAHELYPEQASFSSVQRKLCSVAEKRLIKHADLVFAVNQSIAEEMSRRYEIEQPSVLLNAIDPPADFDPNYKYDLIREKLNLDIEDKILLFQGGFSPNRNLENLVKAMRLVSNKRVKLVMLGFGEFGNVLREIATKQGLLNKTIYFMDAVPQNELIKYSASADWGIIPYPHVDLNSYYCTPNKLFEFIQAGLPILANRSPELERFVSNNGFGHIADLNSASGVANGIVEAFERDDRKRYAENLLEQNSKFTWQEQKLAFSSAFEKLV